MSKRGRNIAVGTALAAGIGYVAGVLTAPSSGKQTRRKIAKSASKARTDSEKQLKQLYSETQDLITKAEKQIAKTRGKAGDELKEAVKASKEAQKKARLLLSALRDGDADDPDLKKMIAEAKKAKSHLALFIKSPPKSS